MPSKTSKPKNKKSKSSKVKSPKTPVETPAPVETSSETPAPVETSSETSAEASVKNSPVDLKQVTDDLFGNLLESFDALTKAGCNLPGLKRQIVALRKQVDKERKDLIKKSGGRRTRKSADGKPRAPSGFAKPAPISKELAKFLNKPEDTELSRTEVTRHLNVYVKKHNLQNPENKKEILPDKKLKKLLNYKDGDFLTFFNLQKHITVLFPKPVATSA